MGTSSHGSINVYHLLFVDDTLILCKPYEDQIRSLRALLLCFKAVSGLKVNLSKSKIVPVGSVNILGDLANILDCKVSTSPMKYLSIPLGATFKTKAIWDGNLEKMECKLVGWKRIY